MDDLSRKFRSIDWKSLQKSARKVQQSTASALKDMVMTDLENKTRAATADTAWGASGADLMFISQGSYRREDYALIMSIVWQRLASSRWRCVYKALEVLKFLIMHGAARCAEEARTAQPHLRNLIDYMARDEHGRDVGEGVRKRASLICNMLDDSDVLEDERARSRELRSKLQGESGASLSSEDYRHGANRPGTTSGDYGASHERASTGNWNDGASRTSTATFKGYGDDDGGSDGGGGGGDGGAYDDAPAGDFGRRAKAAAGVEDLLGDDDAVNGGNAHGDGVGVMGDGDNDDDDDDDFNPRGTGATPASDLDDLFAGLGVSGDMGQQTTMVAAAPTQALSTSQLVQQLAAQNEQAGMQMTVVSNETSGTNLAMTSDVNSVEMLSTASNSNANGASSLFADDFAAVPAAEAQTKTAEGPKKVLSRVSEKEKDPFADLLASGKDSGVL